MEKTKYIPDVYRLGGQIYVKGTYADQSTGALQSTYFELRSLYESSLVTECEGVLCFNSTFMSTPITVLADSVRYGHCYQDYAFAVDNGKHRIAYCLINRNMYKMNILLPDTDSVLCFDISRYMTNSQCANPSTDDVLRALSEMRADEERILRGERYDAAVKVVNEHELVVI